MKNRFLLTSLFGAAGLMGWLTMVSIARGTENTGHLIARQASEPAIDVENLEAWTLVTLKRVYFGYQNVGLNTEEKTELNALASRVSQAPQSLIELRGYTDGMEWAQRGTALGNVRSQAIARYLRDRGISSDRILLVRIDGTTDQESTSNPEQRRVDVRLFVPADSGSNDANSAMNRSGESGDSKAKGVE